MKLSEIVSNARTKLMSSPIRVSMENHAVLKDFNNELLDVEKNIDALLQDIDEPVKVVLMGEVKAGKSTLLNSMVGDAVSPTDVLEATACIIEVYYSSEEEGSIVEKNGRVTNGSIKDIKDILDSHNKDFTFFEDCGLVKLGMPLKKLKKIRIVDTPGLSTITQQNSKKTEEFIQKSDIILWVFNAKSLGQSDIEEHIAKVAKMGKKIVGVINRIDEVESSSSRLIAYMENSLGLYIDEFLAVSAFKGFSGIKNQDAGLYAASGVEEILDYISENIEKEPDLVHATNIKSTLAALLKKEVTLHFEIKTTLEFIKDNILRYKENLDYHNSRIKEYLKNEVNDWYRNEFFKEEESRLLLTAGNIEKLNIRMEQYFNENYVKEILIKKTEDLQKILKENWESSIEAEFDKFSKSATDYNVGSYFNKTVGNTALGAISEDSMKIIGDGVTIGAIGGGAAGAAISAFFAWVGPGAASITLLGAASVFLVPSIIVGAAFGLTKAAGYIRRRDRQNIVIQRQILSNIEDLKESVSPSISYLEEYFSNASDKFLSYAMEQLKFNTGNFVNSEDVESLEKKIDCYINEISSFIGDLRINDITSESNEDKSNINNELEDLVG